MMGLAENSFEDFEFQQLLPYSRTLAQAATQRSESAAKQLLAEVD